MSTFPWFFGSTILAIAAAAHFFGVMGSVLMATFIRFLTSKLQRNSLHFLSS